jgi:hypothetical protein
MKKVKLDYVFSCGRAFLMADGFAIVMEGDKLRDPDLAEIGEKMLREKYKNKPGDDSFTNKIVLDSYHLDEGGLQVWTEELIKHVAGEK